MDHYSLITPCGLEGTEIISLKELLGKEPDQRRVRDSISHHFQGVFEMKLEGIEMEDLKWTPEMPYSVYEGTPRAWAKGRIG